MTAIQLVPGLVILAALMVALWWAAYGKCSGCSTHREPKCECNDPSKGSGPRKPKWNDYGGRFKR